MLDGLDPRSTRSLFGFPADASSCGAGVGWVATDPHLRCCQLLYLIAARLQPRARAADAVAERWRRQGHDRTPSFQAHFTRLAAAALPTDLLSEIVDWLPAVVVAGTAGGHCDPAAATQCEGVPRRFQLRLELPSLSHALEAAKAGDIIAVSGKHSLVRPLCSEIGSSLRLVAADPQSEISSVCCRDLLVARAGGKLFVDGLILSGCVAVTCTGGATVEIRNCVVRGGVVADGDGSRLTASSTSVSPMYTGSVVPYGLVCTGGAHCELSRCRIVKHNLGVKVGDASASVMHCQLSQNRSAAVVAAAGSDVLVSHSDFIDSNGVDAQVSSRARRFRLLDSKVERSVHRGGGQVGVWLLDATPLGVHCGGGGHVEVCRNIFEMGGQSVCVQLSAAAGMAEVAVKENEFTSAGPAVVDKLPVDTPDTAVHIESNMFHSPISLAVCIACDTGGLTEPLPERYRDNRFLGGTGPSQVAAPHRPPRHLIVPPA
eukprot:TRINITY_DN35968_c0_g1_i1.p1 TRINITY_DN35968_c0_g1~~TRINITY_DN35968_c0_g1_i1.p1  ORF type:complete len:487 (+),score=100.97 TRINITY_DN35968_c0_g1_i1:102-1562(+)